MVKMRRAVALFSISLCAACGADFEKPVEFDQEATFDEAASEETLESEAEVAAVEAEATAIAKVAALEEAENSEVGESSEAEAAGETEPVAEETAVEAVDDVATGSGGEATAQVKQGLAQSVRYRGVNLASAEFGMDSEGNGAAGVHGKEYVYPDPAYAAGYTSANYFLKKKMNTFRLPFRWERLQPRRRAKLDQAELTRLRNTVKNLTAKGAFVIVDPHNYARYYTEVIGAGVPNADFADLWARLNYHFKGNKRVIYGLMNEPFNMPTEQWVKAANLAIATIRNGGGTNLVLVPGNAWSGAHSWNQDWYGTPNAKALLAIRDRRNNYAFEVHQYLDANFSGTSTDCPSATAPTEAMQGFTSWLRRYKKKGFVGEFAGGNGGTCMAALDNLLNHMQRNRDVYLGWTYWAAGPWWGNGLSLEPNGSTDKPQMDVLERYLR